MMQNSMALMLINNGTYLFLNSNYNGTYLFLNSNYLESLVAVSFPYLLYKHRNLSLPSDSVQKKVSETA